MRMTQRELADELGYDVTYVVKIEGGRRPPTRQFLARLAQMPGEPLEALSQASASDILRPALPQPPGTLIGREEEVRVLVERILGGARCVTLVGPPGIGKTRLAMEAASQVDTVFPSGSWWTSLVEVQRAEDVADQIAQALGIRREDPSDAVELLLERLRGQQALLVLDNFEHVIEARTVVSDLLAGAPRLTVLITSREALGLVSENVSPVAPLTFPDPTREPSLADVERSSAVELFVVRRQDESSPVPPNRVELPRCPRDLRPSRWASTGDRPHGRGVECEPGDTGRVHRFEPRPTARGASRHASRPPNTGFGDPKELAPARS